MCVRLLCILLCLSSIVACEAKKAPEKKADKPEQGEVSAPETATAEPIAAEPIAAEPVNIVAKAPGLDRTDIVDAIMGAKPAIKACYLAALATDAKLAGKVVVAFEINSDGVVENAAIASSELKHEASEKCISDLIAALTFPAHGEAGPIKVKYPFEFVPTDTAEPDLLTELNYEEERVEPASRARDKSSIRAAIAAQREATKDCYEKELTVTPELAGKVIVAFGIDPEGRPVDVKVTENGLNDNVGQCITNVINGVSFPAGDDLVQVTYPFLFQSAAPGVPVKADEELDFSAGVAAVAGSLDKNEIRSVIGDHADAIKGCYQTLLATKADAKGKVVVSFTIGVEGSVTEAGVSENTTGDDALATCITDSAKTWLFPKPKGSGIVKVQYPFVFESGK